MVGYKELIEKLHSIKQMGWVKTHRAGTTGIGKTLEDLLGIKENNIPGPNAHRIELKAGRKSVSSMLTLFTKSPLPPRANSILLEQFGYPSSKKGGTKRLETTVSAIDYNQVKGEKGFKIDIQDDEVRLIDMNGKVLGYWTEEILRNSFERKLPKLMYIKAEARGRGSAEEFWFNEGWLLSVFDYERFIQLLKEGVILVDIRIGQYLDGRTHDHGTAFRILPDKLDMCFTFKERIL